MDVVTVVCERDFKPMMLQAESILKFLSPCRHWVIINDDKPNKQMWQNALNPWYQNHELIVITSSELFENVNNYPGHYTQQVCKLLISKLIKQDYLVLDAKNFFIKPTDSEEWRNKLGPGIVEYPNHYGIDSTEKISNDMWDTTLEAYSNFFNIPIPLHYLGPCTPFKIQYDVLEQYENFDSLYDDIWVENYARKIQKAVGPSEFIFYSILCKDNIKVGSNVDFVYSNVKHHTLWDVTSVNELDDINSLPDNIKVYGIHWKFLAKCDIDKLSKINNWLKKLGFTNRVYGLSNSNV